MYLLREQKMGPTRGGINWSTPSPSVPPAALRWASASRSVATSVKMGSL